MKSYGNDPHFGALRLAALFVAMVYNGTEAAFKVMHPVLILFLLSVVAVPKAAVPAEESELAADDLYSSKPRTARAPELARNQTAPAAIAPSPAVEPKAIAPRPNPRNRWDGTETISANPVHGSRNL